MIADHQFDPERPQDLSDPSHPLNGWPDALIPFECSPAQAEEHFRLWRRKRRFVPSSFQRGHLPVIVERVYLPFWSFRAETHSLYEGSRGDDRRVENTYTRTDSDGNSETHTETSTTTDYTSVSGAHDQIIEALVVPASDTFDPQLLDKASFFDHSRLVNWRSDYTQDATLPRPEFSLPQGWTSGRAKIEERLKREITKVIGGDSVRGLKITTEFRHTRFQRVLLPFYGIRYTYRGRPSFALLNGQTAVITGAVPRSSLKIVVTVLSSLLAAAILLYIFLH
ncbi:hypothetical protein B9G55_12950 [Saccharibacillus sp. O16]|nr:hypothetical protein B9G55_12950 [Saccharibacillus sp. O16]